MLYYYPDGTFQDSWLREASSDSFVDIHKVNGLRGIYIASQLKENATSTQISPADVVTVVSFDKGAEWKLLQPPKFDDQGQSIDCQRSHGCSLHLGQRLSQLYAVNRTAPVLTSASAVGLIVATGVVGASMKGLPLLPPSLIRPSILHGTNPSSISLYESILQDFSQFYSTELAQY